MTASSGALRLMGGVAAFLSWWMEEMRELTRDVFARISRRRSVVAEISLSDERGTITLKEGEATSTVVAFARAADKSLPIEIDAIWPSTFSPPSGVRAFVRVAKSSVLLRELRLPKGVERNLGRVVELQLERELPIEREQASVDFRIRERGKDAGLTVAICAARKLEIDQITTAVQGWGFALTSVGYHDVDTQLLFEFMPAHRRNNGLSLRRGERILILTALALMLLSATVVVGRWWYERHQVTPVLREARAAAQRVEALQAQMTAQSQATSVIRQRMQEASVGAMILGLTSLVPVESWIQRLEIKKNPDGSAVVSMTALSTSAAQLLDRLRQFEQFEEVSLVSSGPAASKQPKERVEVRIKWRRNVPPEPEA